MFKITQLIQNNNYIASQNNKKDIRSQNLRASKEPELETVPETIPLNTSEIVGGATASICSAIKAPFDLGWRCFKKLLCITACTNTTK